MTRAYIPARDLPNFQGKERDVSQFMAKLRERVLVGKFLAEREIEANRTAEPIATMPDRQGKDEHRQQHKIASSWARLPRQEWCGICVLGAELWSRYEAGLVQPIAPTEDVPEPVEVAYTPPKLPELPSLPIQGFLTKEKNK